MERKFIPPISTKVIYEEKKEEKVEIEEEKPVNVYDTIEIDDVEFLKGEEPELLEAYDFEYDPFSEYFVNRNEKIYIHKNKFLKKYYPNVFEKQVQCIPFQPEPIQLSTGMVVEPPDENQYYIMVIHPDGFAERIRVDKNLTREQLTDYLSHHFKDVFGIDFVPEEYQVILFHPRMYNWDFATPVANAASSPLVGKKTIHEIISKDFNGLGSTPNKYAIPIHLVPVKKPKLRLAKTPIVISESAVNNEMKLLQKEPRYERMSEEELRKRAYFTVKIQETRKALKKLKELQRTHGETFEGISKRIEAGYLQGQEKRKKRKLMEAFNPEKQELRKKAKERLNSVIQSLCDIMLGNPTLSTEEEAQAIEWLVNVINYGYKWEGIDYAKEFQNIIEDELKKSEEKGEGTGGMLQCLMELLRIVDEAKETWEYIYRVRDMVPEFDEEGNIIGYVPGELKTQFIEPTPLEVTMGTPLESDITYTTSKCTDCGQRRLIKPGAKPPSFWVKRKNIQGEIECTEFGIVFQYDNKHIEDIPWDSDYLYTENKGYIADYGIIEKLIPEGAPYMKYQEEVFKPVFLSGFGFIEVTKNPEVYTFDIPVVNAIYEFWRSDFNWGTIQGVAPNAKVIVKMKDTKIEQEVPNGKALMYYCIDQKGNRTDIPLDQMFHYRAELWRCGAPTMDMPPVMEDIWRQIQNKQKLIESGILTPSQEQEYRGIIMNLYKRLHLIAEENPEEIMKRRTAIMTTTSDSKWIEQMDEIEKQAKKRWRSVKQFFDTAKKELDPEELKKLEQEQILREQTKFGEVPFTIEEEVTEPLLKRRKLKVTGEVFEQLNELQEQLDEIVDLIILFEEEYNQKLDQLEIFKQSKKSQKEINRIESELNEIEANISNAEKRAQTIEMEIQAIIEEEKVIQKGKPTLYERIIRAMKKYPTGVHYIDIAKDLWIEDLKPQGEIKSGQESEKFQRYAQQVNRLMAAKRKKPDIFYLHSHPGERPATGRYILRQFITKGSIDEIVKVTAADEKIQKIKKFDPKLLANLLREYITTKEKGKEEMEEEETQEIEQKIPKEEMEEEEETEEETQEMEQRIPEKEMEEETVTFTEESPSPSGFSLLPFTKKSPSLSPPASGFSLLPFTKKTNGNHFSFSDSGKYFQNDKFITEITNILNKQFQRLTKEQGHSPFSKGNIKHIFQETKKFDIPQKEVMLLMKEFIDPYYRAYKASKLTNKRIDSEKIFKSVFQALLEKHLFGENILNLNSMFHHMMI